MTNIENSNKQCMATAWHGNLKGEGETWVTVPSEINLGEYEKTKHQVGIKKHHTYESWLNFKSAPSDGMGPTRKFVETFLWDIR